ncbi:flagellar hook protein FlgE [Rubellimicrobium aerolatum]|uniref:Flagellar hook protein FlgE n=1 Tax=Rubellimicrobium aerolatum TaxID=490979 RepID=A0ABW0S9Y0_9RHOB|nr:flagellar hook protein FlgE [Rubellimicrobium aerolatum]MBP1805092.1 flagellar hook protein FlgE [Rubellimicrobium aerolatum]
MSISSSMNAGVAGLAAQSMSISTISDNIANSSTTGYKRATTDFAAMVIGGNQWSSYTAGGVRATALRNVAAQGALTTTSNSTDLAITGRGMLPVTSITDVRAGSTDLPFLMTTTGSFKPDANGYLTTATGHVLLGVPVADDGVTPAFPRTTSASLVPVRIQANQIQGSPTTEMSISANLPADETLPEADGATKTMSATYYDNLGGAQTLAFTFTPTVPATGTARSNAWTMTVTDSAQGDAVVGTYAMTFTDTSVNNGRIATVARVGTVGGAYDAATGALTVTTASGPIEINVGQPGEAGRFTQFADDFSPGNTTKDGAAASSMTGVEVDASGYVVATYGDGDTRRLFQIPVVDVPNPNGLTALSSQTYAPSEASGAFILWDAGSGPTGEIQGYAREESSVDVAEELTQLIRTQRAYSSNAKIIQTVDEMLQETTNLKR